jgi:hypothetical protein
MKPAHYAVIRYIADPARGEALNVGIVAWEGEQYQLRIDGAAVRRVIRDHPYLHREALSYLDSHLRERLDAAMERARGADEAVPELIRAQKGFPIVLTEPRMTTLHGDTAEALDQALERLVKRIVTPRRRGGGGWNVTSVIERELKPLLEAHLVHPQWLFRETRSGIAQTVSFYANSTANVALDAVSLAVSDADAIRLRGAAEAFKAEDILAANAGVRFVAYCALAERPEFRESQQVALRMIESVGAEVVTDGAEAAKRIAALVVGR